MQDRRQTWREITPGLGSLTRTNLLVGGYGLIEVHEGSEYFLAPVLESAVVKCIRGCELSVPGDGVFAFDVDHHHVPHRRLVEEDFLANQFLCQARLGELVLSGPAGAACGVSSRGAASSSTCVSAGSNERVQEEQVTQP